MYVPNMFCPFDSAKIPMILLRLLLFFYSFHVCMPCFLLGHRILVLSLVVMVVAVVVVFFLYSLTVHLVSDWFRLLHLYFYTTSRDYYFQFPLQCYSLECLGNVPHLRVY